MPRLMKRAAARPRMPCCFKRAVQSLERQIAIPACYPCPRQRSHILMLPAACHTRASACCVCRRRQIGIEARNTLVDQHPLTVASCGCVQVLLLLQAASAASVPLQVEHSQRAILARSKPKRARKRLPVCPHWHAHTVHRRPPLPSPLLPSHTKRWWGRPRSLGWVGFLSFAAKPACLRHRRPTRAC